MNMEQKQPSIVSNDEEGTVADALNAIFSSLPDETSISIASAYFNPGGYKLISENLKEKTGEIRILLGAEAQSETLTLRGLKNSLDKESYKDELIKDHVGNHLDLMKTERNLLGFNIDVNKEIQDLIDFSNRENVKVRRLTKEFLHGKTFFTGSGWGTAMIGSSNFTYAGLSQNRELNMFNYQPNDRELVDKWFEKLWGMAEDFDLAGFYGERFQEFEPRWVYYRMLWEKYEAELKELNEEIKRFLNLSPFQRDGVYRARHLLETRKGVLIADDVGLGKTFIAGELIAESLRNRERVLVIAPAVLRDGAWREFKVSQNLEFEVVSYEGLVNDKRLNSEAEDYLLKFDPRDYSLIVIDEAHNLRNPQTKRYETVHKLIRDVHPDSPAKEVVLLTATPVNNSLMDLYYILKLFISSESEFKDVGVLNLREKFDFAMAKDPEDLNASDLSEVLDHISIRRTRPFIKKFYSDGILDNNETIQVKFPTPHLVRVDYNFSESLPGFINQLERALDGYEFRWGEPAPPGVLAMARYSPSWYQLNEADREPREIGAAGLLRSMLLKRFESSPRAFGQTCKKMANSHEGLVDLIENQGKVAIGGALDNWIVTDADDESLEEWLAHYEDSYQEADQFDIKNLCADIRSDQELLMQLSERAQSLDKFEDPKLKELKIQLIDIIQNAELAGVDESDKNNKRKVLIFSYFSDTVDWIFEYLEDVCSPDSEHYDENLSAYKDRIVSVTGSKDKSNVLFGFAPLTTGAPEGHDDLYDIVVATDVLAEGVNLQQAQHVINYDLPWNPQKLTQRHGRIDRLKSPHKDVYLRSFFPEKDGDLDQLLELEKKLRYKANQASRTLGGKNVISGEEFDINYANTREEIDFLLEENPGYFGRLDELALGGEEFRQQLKQVMEDQSMVDLVTSLPWGSGSGFVKGGTPGWAFCVQVADFPEKFFRFVEVDPASFEPLMFKEESGEQKYKIIQNPLTSLRRAQPLPIDAPHEIPDDFEKKLVNAWELAKSDVFEKWISLTDPVNLMPNIAPAMEKTMQFVFTNPDNFLQDNEVDEITGILQQDVSRKISNGFNAVLRETETTDVEKIIKIQNLISHFGLQKPPEIEPYQMITEEDIHLINWIAVSQHKD